MGYLPAKHAMCLVVRTTKRHTQSVLVPAVGYRSQIDTCRWKAYEGGLETNRLEDGRRSKSICHLECSRSTIRLREQALLGRLIPENYCLAHPFFKLEGSDIFCQVPITPSEAVLESGGGRWMASKMNIPSESVRSTIAPRGKGYPTENGRRISW